MRSERLSVVIPTYGRQAMLERAVATVRVAAPQAEIIVVDDASPEPIRAPQTTRLVRLGENVGVSGARNAGVQAAGGDVIAFLDSDDLWHPDRISRTLPHLDDAPIVVCWSAWTNEPRPRGRHLHGNVSRTIADATTPQVGATMLLRSVWEPFDVSYRTCEDIEWWIRIADGNRVHTVPEALCLMERHDGERHLSGFDQRIEDSWRLLSTPYFASHRRARAFRLQRIGIMARAVGDHRTSRAAFRAASSTMPTPLALARLADDVLKARKGSRVNRTRTPG